MEFKAEQLPPELVNLEISRCKEVRMTHGSISQQKALRKIHTYQIETLIVRKNAFLNASATNTLFHVSNKSYKI
jgi:hypothetical protein